MENKLLALIAYCQRQGVLSRGSAVYEELAAIWDCSADEVADLID